MFSAIIGFLTTNFPTFMTFLGNVLQGGIGIIIDRDPGVDTILNTADDVITLTNAGEIMLLGSIVGLGLFALRWIRSMIPFVN